MSEREKLIARVKELLEVVDVTEGKATQNL